MLAKPLQCSGCPLESRGAGFSPASDNPRGNLFFLAEALGREEAWQGSNLVGPSGGFFDRLLYRNGIRRSESKVSNCLKCQPPGNELRGAPWEWGALQHCKRAYLNEDIEEWLRLSDPAKPRVMVTLGAVALRQALGLDEVTLENWHGTVNRDPSNRFWIIPTFHPAYLLVGAWNLTGVVSFDLQRAKEVLEKGWNPRPVKLHLDPSVEWFRMWATQYLEATRRDPFRVWLSVDVETPDTRGRDEGELTAKDKSYQILRINFSCNEDEGITVPCEGGYLSIIEEVLLSEGPKCFWNWLYDCKRIWARGWKIGGPIWDFMVGWHFIQSDVPKGLGFVSPVFSDYGAWKHLAHSNPVEYAAVDPLQNHRNSFAIAKQLEANGQWEVFQRHTWELWRDALIPSLGIGVLIDRPEVVALEEKLGKERERIAREIQEVIPLELLPLDPKAGLQDPPDIGEEKWLEKDFLKRPLRVVEAQEEKLVQVCLACGAQEVSKKHSSCKKDGLEPKVELQERTVTRWYRQLPYNPQSPPQVLKLIKHLGLKPGKAKKDKTKETTDKDTLERLSAKAPVFGKHLLFRQVAKVKGTYVDGTLRRLKDQEAAGVYDGRIHATVTNNPSSLRLSYVSPNLQNVIGDKSGKEALAAGFRKCIIAAPRHKLSEVDFSAIEAVLTGWCIGNKDFIRLGRLGIHAYVAAHELKREVSLAWSDADLAKLFKEIKESDPQAYDRSKRGVYATLYAATPSGISSTFPKHFPTRPSAEKFQRLIYDVCPGLEDWQWGMRLRAAKEGFLGGKTHPYRYIHWFWKVFDYRRLKKITPVDGWKVVQFEDGSVWSRYLGDDAKRCVAFFPQSIAAGIIKESTLRLHDPENENYIGDFYHGETPLRALVHDSNLGEVPEEKLGEYTRRVVLEMARPIKELPIPLEWGWGPYLSIGVEAKVGQNWLGYDSESNPEGMKKVEISGLLQEAQGQPAIAWSQGVADDDFIEVNLEEGDEEDEYLERLG